MAGFLASRALIFLPETPSSKPGPPGFDPGRYLSSGSLIHDFESASCLGRPSGAPPFLPGAVGSADLVDDVDQRLTDGYQAPIEEPVLVKSPEVIRYPLDIQRAEDRGEPGQPARAAIVHTGFLPEV
jgi:hypothetical protein